MPWYCLIFNMYLNNTWTYLQTEWFLTFLGIMDPLMTAMIFHLRKYIQMLTHKQFCTLTSWNSESFTLSLLLNILISMDKKWIVKFSSNKPFSTAGLFLSSSHSAHISVLIWWNWNLGKLTVETLFASYRETRAIVPHSNY